MCPGNGTLINKGNIAQVTDGGIERYVKGYGSQTAGGVKGKTVLIIF